MSKKHHGGPGPVPPANQPKAGPSFPAKGDENQPTDNEINSEASFQNQDAQRRLGDFSGAGEHPRQQPTRLNDGETHTKDNRGPR